MKFKNETELLEYTENIKGKTFREIDTANLIENKNARRNKGLLGQIVETGFYKYNLNTNQEADFTELGIELKVAGLKKLKNGEYSVKERLVLTKINFDNIVKDKFNESHLFGKNEKILIIWYEYDKNKKKEDYKIIDYQLYDLKKDEDVIKNDYYTIQEKVKDGKAHELSEGDTSFLGACPKASTSKDRTKQPFSDIPAKPRAFDLKLTYMNHIYKNRDAIEKPKYLSVEDYIQEKIAPYIGKTQIEIYKELTSKKYVKKIPKGLSKLISNRIIGKDKELQELDPIFQKTNFVIKNIPIRNNKPIERISFKTMSLSEFEDDWDESYWKSYFEELTLIMILYEEQNIRGNGNRVLKGVKKFSFTEEDLRSFELTYKQIQKTIRKEDTNLLPTPRSFEGQYLEVAPKGMKGDNAYENFLKNDKTKVCFMLNKKFIMNKLELE